MDLRILDGGTAFPDGGCQSRSCTMREGGGVPRTVWRKVANESRPGVVSELLNPEQAARKARAVAARVSKLSVVGIAGPGDPLANPDRTFDTLRRVKAELPNVRLCLSTNGLMLAKYVDTIIGLGIDHVTMTINAVDAAVAAKIYPWVIWEGRRIEGREGAEILIREQFRGLEALVARDVPAIAPAPRIAKRTMTAWTACCPRFPAARRCCAPGSDGNRANGWRPPVSFR